MRGHAGVGVAASDGSVAGRSNPFAFAGVSASLYTSLAFEEPRWR
jgi:hypothetical protein